MYTIRLWKYGRTWTFTVANPSGGGFGSNRATMREAREEALRSVPAGSDYCIERCAPYNDRGTVVEVDVKKA